MTGLTGIFLVQRSQKKSSRNVPVLNLTGTFREDFFGFRNLPVLDVTGTYRYLPESSGPKFDRYLPVLYLTGTHRYYICPVLTGTIFDPIVIKIFAHVKKSNTAFIH